MTLTGNQIRQAFLNYFTEKSHEHVKSASLIPHNDPTLYFTNAGMVPFKNYFTGQETPLYPCATSSQKCMRVSGKHNDLENVGRTARHHTFFEMLGNFSFGDYFKKEAIEFAWEFLTKILDVPANKLWITVFREDDEAYDLWLHCIGIPQDKIVRMDEKDNFWAMGETGPCGPCSEIHYEQDIPCSLNNKDCEFGKCDCNRYVEIWNLVFMQYDRHNDGTMKPLPKPSIDTGMGLERLTAILQNKTSNYDSDLFMPIITKTAAIVQKKYGQDLETDISMRVLADHIRSTVFLIADGVLPSNEGRGYVLRRIMRRAIRHGKILDQTRPFFYRLAATVINEMGGAYPELITNQETIEKVIFAEEERFFTTLEKGLKLLSIEITATQSQGKNVLSGEVAFKLYDTFGFPLDLTEIIAKEYNLTVNQQRFDICMTKQKERARAGWKGSGAKNTNEIYFSLAENHTTEFLGYNVLESAVTVTSLIQNNEEMDEITNGEFEFITNATPFYAESGGQIGDKGLLTADNFKAIITDTQKPVAQMTVHKARVKSGKLNVGRKVTLTVQREHRLSTMRNHTATHLLNAALRKTLGTHVRQSGSYVDDKILRFDFSHFEAIPKDILLTIENTVNSVILDDIAVEHNTMTYDDAMTKGALAFFGDKYGDEVRVISVSDFSVELCGGTHLKHTSEIACFKILSEGSIASGIRRIEAITGLNAIQYFQSNDNIILSLSKSLKTQPDELVSKIETNKDKIKKLEKEIAKLKEKLLQGGATDLLKNKQNINGIDVVLFVSDDPKSVRNIVQTMTDKIKSGIAIVSAEQQDKVIIAVGVTTDLQTTYPANKLLAPLAELINGRGGGKADMAQAGGNQPVNSDNIISCLSKLIKP